MEIFSLGAGRTELGSPGTIWNAVGASATSLEPIPKNPPTLTTYASILVASFVNRMSCTCLTFALRRPRHWVPLSFGGGTWSGLCAAMNCAAPSFLSVGRGEPLGAGVVGDWASAVAIANALTAGINASFLSIDGLLCRSF